MTKAKIGIIGLGGIAQLVHLPILSKLNSVEISAVSDINKNRLKTISDKFNIKNFFSDYREMLEKTDLDAVIISTPTATHTQIAIDCLNADKDLLIEKPISKSLDEAIQIDALALKKKRKVMVGLNARFRPDAMLLKSLVNSGELGNIFYVRCGWTRKQSSSEKWFIKKSESGGGVIIDLGIVILDLSMWILDFPEIHSVSVQNFYHQTKNVEDSAIGFIRFKNSSVINFEVSWSLHSEVDSLNLIAFGSKGTVHLNPFRAYRRMNYGNIDLTPAHNSNVKGLYKKSYENELKHFIGAIKNLNPLYSSSTDAVHRMQLIEGIYKSAETNSEIKF